MKCAPCFNGTHKDCHGIVKVDSWLGVALCPCGCPASKSLAAAAQFAIEVIRNEPDRSAQYCEVKATGLHFVGGVGTCGGLLDNQGACSNAHRHLE